MELGVVPLYFQGFPAQLLASKITLLGHSGEHAYVGEKERIVRLGLKSAANVSECYALVPVTKVSETLRELHEP
jgi:hypothetical protein